MNGIDLDQLFHGGNGRFEFDATRANLNVSTLVKKGKEFAGKFKKADSDEKIIDNYNKKREEKEESSNEELRKSIEQYKKEVLEKRQEQQQNKEKVIENKTITNSYKGNER
jgi:phage-related minor tail protein